MITLNKTISGKILDIGGGGEGIIGRLYREQVIAIDNRKEELDEAPVGCEKILMDATALAFSDSDFDHVTFFYTLMFMSADVQRQAITEAARVLKNEGELHIWDCDIPSAYPDPFCIIVDILLPKEHMSTTYGIMKLAEQTRSAIIQMCSDAGLHLVTEQSEKEGFYLRFRKGIGLKDTQLGKCGFYCGCCPTYLKGGCNGCIEEHKTGDCYTRDCVLQQGIDCCGGCEQFPCDTIMTKPHTTVLDKDWLRWKMSSVTNR